MERVYAFTNENLTSYQNIFDFKGKQVLSVLGSGDQYFSSILFGAKSVDLYDINKDAWDYFLFKLELLKDLSYEDFFECFINNHQFNLLYFEQVIKKLPNDIKERVVYRFNACKQLLPNISYLDMASVRFDQGTSIPYFSIDNYKKLQDLLQNSELPYFYHTDLEVLPNIVQNIKYDLLITSNIYCWLNYKIGEAGVQKYKNLLNQFNCSDIQAMYTWWLNKERMNVFEKQGFEIYSIPASRENKMTNDNIIRLRNK